MISAPGYRTLITHLVVCPGLQDGASTVEYNFGLARELNPGSDRPPSFVAGTSKE